MESVIPCEPNGSGDSLLSSTDPQQAVNSRDFCYTYSPENPGPEVAGLQPHSTMLLQFKDVVSYRSYRLNNIRANVRDSENRRIGKTSVASRTLSSRSETLTAASPSRRLNSFEHCKKGSTPCGHRKAQRSARWPSYSEATRRTSTNREVSLRR